MNLRGLTWVLALATVWSVAMPVRAQYVNVQVHISSMWHREGDNCWESGEEEYTGIAYFNLDGGTWSGGACFGCDYNGDCRNYPDYYLLNTNTLSARLGILYIGFEDDEDPRCSFDGDDDCLAAPSWTFTIRELTRTNWNVCTDWGGDDHKISFEVYWNWIVPPAPSLAGASRVTPTSFAVNWSGLANYRVTACYLDVAADPGFTNRLAGYSGRDVGVLNEVLVPQMSPGQTYYFRVRATNEAGMGPYSATNSVTLPIPPGPAWIRGIAVADNLVNISLSGAPGYPYELQRASSLEMGGNWQDTGLRTNAPADGQFDFIVEPEWPMRDTVFYRLRRLEPSTP